MKKFILALLLITNGTTAFAFDRSEATVKCMHAIRQKATIPKSVDFDRGSTECKYGSTAESWTCWGAVDLKNAFGMMMPYVWICEATERHILVADVLPTSG